MNKLCDFYNKESNTCDIDKGIIITCNGFMSKETGCLFCGANIGEWKRMNNVAREFHNKWNEEMDDLVKISNKFIKRLPIDPSIPSEDIVKIVQRYDEKVKEVIGERKCMCNLTEITCPECGGKLEVFWDRDCGTSVIACSNEECKFKTEICNKEINSAFYMQYYNKMKYKEDLQKEIELRHG